jgi:hypothetical protein
LALTLALGLSAFFVVTGRSIYTHVEYAGALQQFGELAAHFRPPSQGYPGDIVLLRAGARDLPDVVATPLHFIYGIDALAVKSSSPASYATPLAAQVRRWQAQGRTVYVAYSASGGDFVLPGFALAPVAQVGLSLREFQQLEDQKPSLAQPWALPLAIYRLEPAAPGRLTAPLLAAGTLAVGDFAAQVRGFYPPDPAPAADGTSFAWTSGDALLRIPWLPTNQSQALTLRLAAGPRPADLPPAQVCIAAATEQSAEQSAALPDTAFTPIGCYPLAAGFAPITIALPVLPPTPTGTLLIRIQSDRWVPADHDPRLTDRRPVGIQFAGLSLP